MNSYVKYGIIAGVVIILGFIALRWYKKSIEDNTRASIEKLALKNDSLNSMLAVKKLEAVALIRIIDSVSNVSQRTIRDTIYINHSYVTKTNYVKHLPADSGIAFLAKRFNTPVNSK
jgi:hypothetical protein